MTEQEAIMYLEVTKKCSEEGSVGYLQKEMCDVAISALEEIQQYREIGTVEYFKKIKTCGQRNYMGIYRRICSLQKYRNCGRVPGGGGEAEAEKY